MAFKSYTSCVQPADYHDPPTYLEAVLADVALLFAAPEAVGPALMFELETVLDYMLNGKLVCLGGDVCAVGQVLGFEPASEKSFPDNIDNDFSINLLLYPSVLGDFIDKDLDTSWKEVKKLPQGGLVTEVPGMPEPHEAEGGKRYQPYSAKVKIEDAYKIGGWNTMFPLKEAITAPVFHLECEGSRISDMYHTLEDISGLGTGVCKLKLGPIPIGKLFCSVVAALLWPIVVAALVAAWLAADDGSAADPRVGADQGELEAGDFIVATGRWTFDASHQGWNEMHPVKTLQRISRGFSDLPVGAEAVDLIVRWCRAVMVVPPGDRAGPGGTPASMTPSQQQTWDGQLDPRNRWIVHPDLDGCAPSEAIR